MVSKAKRAYFKNLLGYNPVKILLFVMGLLRYPPSFLSSVSGLSFVERTAIIIVVLGYVLFMYLASCYIVYAIEVLSKKKQKH